LSFGKPIAHSFVANIGLSKSLGNISTVSSDVKEAKDQISAYLVLAQESGATAKESTVLIRQVSDDVGSNLATLTGTLGAIKTQTDALHTAIAGLPPRLDQLETKVLDATKTLGEKHVPLPATASAGVDASVAKRFLETSPLSANLMTYACVLAKQKGANLSIPLVCSAIETKLESYMNGFLACMDSAQLVSAKYIPESERNFQIKMVHPTLQETTKTYIEGFLTRVYKDKPDILNTWLIRLKNVEALYP
jgi:hypothetical protein